MLRLKQFFGFSHPELKDDSIQHYVRGNASYYIYKWKFARGFSRWNFAAFFLGPLWLVLRKNYGWGIALALAGVLADYYLAPNPYHLVFVVELMLFCGLFGNDIYYRRYRKSVARLKRGGVPEEGLPAALRALGGRDWLAPLGLLLGMAAASLLLPSAFGVHLYRNRAFMVDAGSLAYARWKPEVRVRDLNRLRWDYQRAFMQGSFERSISVNRNTVRLAMRRLGEDDPMTIGLQSDLVRTSLQAGHYEDARRLTESLLREYQVQFGQDHLFTTFMLNNLVSVYIAQGLYQKARIEANNCLLILEKYPQKETHPIIQGHIAAIYSNLGVVQQQYGEYGLAEKNHQDAFSLAMESSGGPTITSWIYLERLADFYKEEMKLDEADRLYRQERKLAERTLGLENPLMSSVLLKQGDLHFVRRQVAEADKLFQQAFMTNRHFYGNTHTATAEAAYLLGKSAFAQGNLAEAENYLDMSLDICGRAIGTHNAIYGDYLIQRAELDLFRNNLNPAEIRLASAHKIFNEVFGETHGRLLPVLEPLAEIYTQRGNAKNLQKIRQQMKRIQEGLHPAGQPNERRYHWETDGVNL